MEEQPVSSRARIALPEDDDLKDAVCREALQTILRRELIAPCYNPTCRKRAEPVRGSAEGIVLSIGRSKFRNDIIYLAVVHPNETCLSHGLDRLLREGEYEDAIETVIQRAWGDEKQQDLVARAALNTELPFFEREVPDAWLERISP